MKQQNTLRLGSQTGSLTNHLMSYNNSIPKVGEGATHLMWTDRHALEVVAVNEDNTVAVLAPINAKRTDKNGFSESQEYNYDNVNMDAQFVVVYKNGSWRQVCHQVIFTDDFSKWIDANMSEWRNPDSAARKEIYPDGAIYPVFIPGKTRIKTTYPKISLLFGRKEEYWDPSF